MEYDRDSFEDFEKLYSGVTRMPEVVDYGEFRAAMGKARSKRPSGRGRVLMSIALSETGEILDAVPVKPPQLDGITGRVVCITEDGTELPPPSDITEDPELVETATMLCRLLKFRPAERDGIPVPFPDYRFGLEF